MKCLVLYFSQTGNTEKVAKAVQTGVKKAAGHCDILKIKDANPKRGWTFEGIECLPQFSFIFPKSAHHNPRVFGGLFFISPIVI